MPRKSNTRNPLGTIIKRQITKDGRKIWAWDVRKRVPKLDENGKPLRDEKGRKIYVDKNKRCYSASEANTALLNLPTIIEEERQEEIKAKEIAEREKTFFELCDYFAEHKIIPPVYVGKRKVAGYSQNHSAMLSDLKQLKEFFGDVLLSQIKYADVVQFADFLTTTKNNKYKDEIKPLSAATINKKLGFLRHVLNVAIEELDWLVKSPFKRGAKLIHKNAEQERRRVMSFEEEKLLLAECNKPHRSHLKFFIILAVDTAMRRSEIFKMRWWQVDFENRVIYLTDEAAKFSKTGAEGILPMTDRVYELLSNLKKPFTRKTDLVVGRIDFKKSWKAICDDAGVVDLQFRDLRATAIVRMMNAGVPGDIVRKISRHSKDTDIFLKHYTRIDEANARQIGAKLSQFNRSQDV